MRNKKSANKTMTDEADIQAYLGNLKVWNMISFNKDLNL